MNYQYLNHPSLYPTSTNLLTAPTPKSEHASDLTSRVHATFLSDWTKLIEHLYHNPEYFGNTARTISADETGVHARLVSAYRTSMSNLQNGGPVIYPSPGTRAAAEASKRLTEWEAHYPEFANAYASRNHELPVHEHIFWLGYAAATQLSYYPGATLPPAHLFLGDASTTPIRRLLNYPDFANHCTAGVIAELTEWESLFHLLVAHVMEPDVQKPTPGEEVLLLELGSVLGTAYKRFSDRVNGAALPPLSLDELSYGPDDHWVTMEPVRARLEKLDTLREWKRNLNELCDRLEQLGNPPSNDDYFVGAVAMVIHRMESQDELYIPRHSLFSDGQGSFPVKPLLDLLEGASREVLEEVHHWNDLLTVVLDDLSMGRLLENKPEGLSLQLTGDQAVFFNAYVRTADTLQRIALHQGSAEVQLDELPFRASYYDNVCDPGTASILHGIYDIIR